jgi:hypothetical protein
MPHPYWKKLVEVVPSEHRIWARTKCARGHVVEDCREECEACDAVEDFTEVVRIVRQNSVGNDMFEITDETLPRFVIITGNTLDETFLVDGGDTQESLVEALNYAHDEQEDGWGIDKVWDLKTGTQVKYRMTRQFAFEHDFA